MGVKGGMMDLRHRNAVGRRWLAKPLVLIGDDVGGVYPERFEEVSWQAKSRTRNPGQRSPERRHRVDEGSQHIRRIPCCQGELWVSRRSDRSGLRSFAS